MFIQYKPRISQQKLKKQCRKIYEIPKEAEVISLSKNDKIWLLFNDHICESNLFTGDAIIIPGNIEEVILFIKFIRNAN